MYRPIAVLIAATAISLSMATPAFAAGGPTLLGGGESTTPTDWTPSTCDVRSVKHHKAKAKGISRAMFAHRKWQDATPVKPAQKRWFRWHLRCIEHDPTDRTLRHYQRAEKRSFYRYRRSGGPLTPYGQWAIPEYIVACESGGSWSAYNPSGALGPYQLLGWGAPFPANSWAKRMAHHRIAGSLWAGGSGASHWVCA